MDLTEAEDIKKRWQEILRRGDKNTQNNYKNDLHAARYQKNKQPNQKNGPKN